MKTLDQFLKDPDAGGETVKVSDGEAWVMFLDGSISLDGTFTVDELKEIVRYMERLK